MLEPSERRASMLRTIGGARRRLVLSLFRCDDAEVLDALAGALEPAATTRRSAQAWLQLRGYEPTALRLGALTRLGARATAAHIAFDDHPNEKRFADRIETVTVDSVFAWLQRTQLGAAPVTVTPGMKLPATVAPRPELRAGA